MNMAATQTDSSFASVADALESSPSAKQEGTLLVAFASMDGECVDQHFGSALAFYVYAVTATSAEYLAEKHFAAEKKDGNEDKLKPKMQFLVGADMVYCGSIGGSATRQLVALGVTPVKVKEGPDVSEIIEEVQADLVAGNSPTLQRILQSKRPKSDNRFDEMDDQGWDD